MVKNQKRVIIIMGPPGSGKGTQATLLSEKFNLYYLETSKLLEQTFISAKPGEGVNINGRRYGFLKERKLWETGILCSPPFVSFLIKQKIRSLFKEGRSLVLAGSPRTLEEGQEVVPILKKLYGKGNIRVILLEISSQESIFRNSHRKICELMRHPILYSKETVGLKRCPLDGSKLMARKGLDAPETIRVRLREYKNRTFPLVEYFEKSGLKVKRVNGSPAPSIVFANILKALKEK